MGATSPPSRVVQTLALECLRSRELRAHDPSRTNPSAKSRPANGQTPCRMWLRCHALLTPLSFADRRHLTSMPAPRANLLNETPQQEYLLQDWQLRTVITGDRA